MQFIFSKMYSEWNSFLTISVLENTLSKDVEEISSDLLFRTSYFFLLDVCFEPNKETTRASYQRSDLMKTVKMVIVIC